jgi:putative hemolysin
MPSIATELLIILVLIIANGIFALSEIAVVSARKTRLQQWAERGDRRAAVALELANAPEELLSTVQIGITLIGIMTGAVSGATVAEAISDWVLQFSPLAPYSGTIGLGVVVIVITYLSLVVGELVPKRLGLSSPERVAAAVAPPMRALSRLATPIVRLLTFSTNGLIRLLGLQLPSEPAVTEDDVHGLLQQGARVGIFEPHEPEIVERVFRFTDLRVNMLLTPRTQIVWLDLEDSLETVRQKIESGSHWWFPVCEGSIDRVVGVVDTRDLLKRCLAGEAVNLRATMKPPLFVTETMRAMRLLELFQERGQQLAVVISEYGGIEGVVSLADFLEALVGHIPEVGEASHAPITRREDGSWIIDGQTSVYDLKATLDLDELSHEAGGGYHTLGGMMMAQLGRLPAVGDHLDWAGWRFEVVDLDGRRVDKVLVTPLQEVNEGTH